MPWKYILNIRINNDVVYKRDIDEKENYILDTDKNLLDKNTLDCEILSNVEVLKHGRKR